MAAALTAVEPGAAVRRYLRREGSVLLLNGTRYDLSQIERVFLVGAGKAAAAMASAAAEVLGEYLSDGIVIVKDSGTVPPVRSSYRIVAARHPLPDERGIAATQTIAELLASAGERDLVLALISGGASALMTLPAPGIELGDMQALTGSLLASGATINEINTLRKHLDTIKGGGMARLAAPAQLATLILSDVVGNPLDIIASGPTVGDEGRFADAYAILERYTLLDVVPTAIRARLEAGLRNEIPENPSAGDPIFRRVQNVLVASNAHAAEAALQAAAARSFHTLLLSSYVQGEARGVGAVLAAIGREIAHSARPLPRPACLVMGGETTVTLRGAGKGGRNQELTLGAVRGLAGLADLFVIGLATDGDDGPTDAAGAVASGETLARGLSVGLVPEDFLARNDAYHYFAQLDDLLLPGPSGTNVNDLYFLFAV
jgi:hydroxypyruvate reductase